MAASGTLLFAPGETTKSVDIALVDDALNEDDETFRVTLSNPTGGPALGTPSTTDVRIYADTDPVPLIGIGDSTVVEGDSGTTAARLHGHALGLSGRTVTVGYRTSGGSEGSDYNFTAGTLTFAPGETSKTFNVNVIGDTTPEPKESFDILLQDQSNAYFIDSVGTGTILNDDAALSVNDVTVTEGDSGQTALNFTVGIQFPTVNPVSVNYASADGTADAGPDYGGTAGTLTFSPGETTKAVTVHAFGDTFDEPDETFFLNLSGAQTRPSRTRGSGTSSTTTRPRCGSPKPVSAGGARTSSRHRHAHGRSTSPAGVDFATATARNGTQGLHGVSGAYSSAQARHRDLRRLLTEDSYQEAEGAINLTLSNPTGGRAWAASDGHRQHRGRRHDAPQPNRLDESRT